MATINGTAAGETLNGTTGDDTINGNGGNDIIYGNGVLTGIVDRLNGGAGNDTIYVGSAGGYVIVHGDADNDTIHGSSQTSKSEFLYGDDGADTIYGNGGRDSIYGGTGNDKIYTGNDITGTNGVASWVEAGDGDDEIWSGGGISQLDGGAGNDTFYADQGLWTGSEAYTGGTGNDKILATSSNQNIGIAEINGVELISGGTFSNVNIQTKAANPGSFVFLNLTGIELHNINVIKGQGGDDSIFLEGSSGGNLTLARNDTVFGGAGNDSIYSGFGNDTLRGDAGNDVLVGGVGLDTLTGSTGADTFRINALSESLVSSADRITDFSSAEGDKISLSSIDADDALSGDQAFNFIGVSAFSGIAGELRAELAADGFTHIYGDTNADSIADFEIVLTNAASLSATDFIL